MVNPLFRFLRRREVLKALGMGLGLVSAGRARAQESDPGSDAPQEGDLFVFAEGDREGKVVAPADVASNGPPVPAFPMDPTSGRVRNGSRLNRVVLIRLALEEIGEGTRTQAADGILAYSAVCTHTACDVSEWVPETRHLLCPCHGSEFDAADGARVMNGPAPRKLAILPLKLSEGRLTAAGGFVGRLGSKK